MSDVRQKGADEIFCSSCGEIIKKEAEICPKCGVRQKPAGSGGAVSGGKKIGWHYFADAMKKYAVFSGRARRAEFWWYLVCVFAIQFIASFIGVNLLETTWLTTIATLGLMLPSLTVWWRRMHDVGKPGGYCFIPIYSIILAATAGVSGPNQYGQDPKGE